MIMKDMMGHTFGRLHVVRYHGKDQYRQAHWVCLCACGNETVVAGSHLRRGNTQSCGCIRKDHCGVPKKFPGRYSRRTLGIWHGMNARCYNPNTIGYENYGGRGIRVCHRWKEFPTFLLDMGDCPTGHSLERKDNDGDYSPENCEWIPRALQARNKRSSIRLTHNGETLHVSAWAERLGVPVGRLLSRYRRKWSTVDILEAPFYFRKRGSDAHR